MSDAVTSTEQVAVTPEGFVTITWPNITKRKPRGEHYALPAWGVSIHDTVTGEQLLDVTDLKIYSGHGATTTGWGRYLGAQLVRLTDEHGTPISSLPHENQAPQPVMTDAYRAAVLAGTTEEFDGERFHSAAFWYVVAEMKVDGAVAPELTINEARAAIGLEPFVFPGADELYVQPPARRRSAWISLDLPKGAIAPVPGGVTDHHVTVVYLGPDVDDEAFAAAVERARRAAAQLPGPLTGFVGGRGTFEGDEEKIPVWARIVSPGVRQLRGHLADLDGSGRTTYRPHVTLAYVPPGQPLPDPLPTTEVTLTHLSVHRKGSKTVRIPLGPAAAAASAAVTPEGTG